MKSGMRYAVIAAAFFGFSLMVAGYASAGEAKGSCPNPIKETIDKTPSIKAMQSQPAPAKKYVRDMLGRRIPTQTEKNGKF